jgi:hypothetical protein
MLPNVFYVDALRLVYPLPFLFDPARSLATASSPLLSFPRVAMVTDSYFISDSHYHHAPVKTESSPSPDLLPASASLQPHYQLSFPSQYHSSHLSTQPPSQPSILCFGVSTSFNPPMDYNRQWQTVGSSQNSSGSGSAPKYDNNLDSAMSFSDDYDGMSDLLEIGHGNAGSTRTLESNSVTGEKIVRRRSSKGALSSLSYTPLPLTFF